MLLVFVHHFSAYELLFCDTTTGRQITSATELRDVKWGSWTCTLGKLLCLQSESAFLRAGSHSIVSIQ